MREQRVVLEDDADLAPLGGDIVNGGIADDHASGGLVHEAGDDAQQGRLPAARRADQGHQLPVTNFERHVVHGQAGAVAVGDAVECEGVPNRARRYLKH